MTDRSHLDAMFAAIRAVARKIPKGRVATYGQLAELAGFPGAARVAAASLKTLDQPAPPFGAASGKRPLALVPSHHVPWHRVVGKAGKLRGRIAIHDPVGAAMQRQLLEAEGVPVGDSGLMALDVYGWLPTEQSGRGASLRRRPRSASTRRASSSRR